MAGHGSTKRLIAVGIVVVVAASLVLLVGPTLLPGDMLAVQFYSGDTPVGLPLRLSMLPMAWSVYGAGLNVTGFTVTATVGTTDPHVTEVRVVIHCAVWNAPAQIPVKNVSLLDSGYVGISQTSFTTPLISLDAFLTGCGVASGETCTLAITGCATFTDGQATLRQVAATAPAIHLLRQAEPAYTYTFTLGGTPT